ncbi:MAG: DMT family transporter [Cellvibrionaceae bacterium]
MNYIASCFYAIPLGIRYMVMSAIGFSLMGMFVKLTHAQGIPVLEIVAARALISAVISFVDIKRKGILLLGQRRGLLFLRGTVGAFALMCVFYALVNIPFADATVLQYLHPMFTAVLAILFLRERLHRSTLTCIALSFVGLIVVVRPDFLFGSFTVQYAPIAIIAAILGAFGSAVGYVLVRKLNATEDPSVIIFYFPIIALPLSLLLLGKDIVMPQGWSWLFLLLVGMTTQLGQVGLTKAMQTETASKATSFSYLQVAFAALLGWWVFSEIPTVWTFVGGGLILLGAFINVVWKEK